MIYVDAALGPFRRYADFSGRSSRLEFWLFALAVTIALGSLIGLAFLAIGIAYVASDVTAAAVVFAGVAIVLLLLYLVALVCVFVPLLAVCVRRLHDTDHSGFWLLVALFVPFGVLVVLYFLANPGNPLPNEWGPNPQTAGDVPIASTSGGTATDHNDEGPVVYWVAPPRGGTESTDDRLAKVVSVVVVAMVIAALLGGLVYGSMDGVPADQEAGPIVLPSEATPTATETASTPAPASPIVLPSEATPTATETATTPAPAGTSAVASTALAKWEEFLDHFLDSTDELSAIETELAGIDFDDADAFDANNLKLQRWADGEAEWLDAHPVDECYAGTYTPWSKAVTLVMENGYEDDPTQYLVEMEKVADSIPISDVACTS